MTTIHFLSASSLHARRYLQAGGTWLGVAIGLAIGCLVAFAFVWYIDRGPKPFVEKVGKMQPLSNNQTGKTGLPDPNTALTKDVDAGKNSEEFQFSHDKILSKSDSRTPPPSASPTTASVQDKLREVESKANPDDFIYHIQAGSFAKLEDADKQKANITLTGLDVTVEAARVEGKGMVYRVKVGPYASLEDANVARATLSQNKIDTVAPQKTRKITAVGVAKQ